MNKWELGHCYDLTEYFTQLVKGKKIIGVNYEHGYFVCRDVWDIHIYRILANMNGDFEPEEGAWIVEQNDIRYDKFVDFCVDRGLLDDRIEYDYLDEREMWDKLIKDIEFEAILYAIVAYDYDSGFDNYSTEEFSSKAECLDAIDDGYGITKINTNNMWW